MKYRTFLFFQKLSSKNSLRFSESILQTSVRLFFEDILLTRSSLDDIPRLLKDYRARNILCIVGDSSFYLLFSFNCSAIEDHEIVVHGEEAGVEESAGESKRELGERLDHFLE